MTSNVDDIIGSLVTKNDVGGVLEQLERLRTAVYKTEAGDLKRMLESEVGVGLAEAVKNDLAQMPEKYDDLQFLRKFFDEIDTQLKSIPVVRLELAIDPSRTFLNEVKNNLGGYLGKQVMIELAVEPKMLGGVRLTYAGKYVDCSLEAKWDEVWKEIESRLG